jgi:NAD-dependent dihydropyrimidine dehydrogenase PreA subunit/nitroreductase
MTEKLHWIDRNTCKGDRICVEICPEDIFDIVNGHAAAVDARADDCILCGQCVAVCPNGSIQIPKLPTEDFRELDKQAFDYDEFLGFLNLRRSVRTFKDRPVERDLIDRILEAAATAPMGFPPHTTEVLVIDRREELDFLLQALVEEYGLMHKGFSNPFTRAMIRLSAGAENYATLKNWILDISKRANQAYRRDRSDRYMYRAPVLMLFHANRRMISYEENAHLVCSHAMMAAVSLGLGTTILGLVPPIVDRSKILRKRYGIPKRNKVITSLILGHPKYKYKKGIRRNLAGVRYF